MHDFLSMPNCQMTICLNDVFNGAGFNDNKKILSLETFCPPSIFIKIEYDFQR